MLLLASIVLFSGSGEICIPRRALSPFLLPTIIAILGVEDILDPDLQSRIHRYRSRVFKVGLPITFALEDLSINLEGSGTCQGASISLTTFLS